MKHLGPNHRPCPELSVLRVEPHMVPLAIHLPACLVSYGLFSERPHPHNPHGKRVLGITMQICAACSHLHRNGAGGSDHPHGSKPCPERCHGCPHACWAELTLYIKQTPEFPLPPDEVECFLYRYFNMDDLAAAKIAADYDFLYDVARGFESPAGGLPPALAGADVPNPRRDLPDDAAQGAAGVTEAPGTPQPAVRGKPGAPQLACNAWLDATMCALPDPRAYGHLRPEWRARYLQQMGVAPADLDKSFREAARHYLHRILHARGEEDAGGQAGDGQAGQSDA